MFRFLSHMTIASSEHERHHSLKAQLFLNLTCPNNIRHKKCTKHYLESVAATHELSLLCMT